MAKDVFHDSVRQALQDDGWTITHDGYRLITDLLKDALTVDLGAEKLITAEKGPEKIAVEPGRPPERSKVSWVTR